LVGQLGWVVAVVEFAVVGVVVRDDAVVVVTATGDFVVTAVFVVVVGVAVVSVEVGGTCGVVGTVRAVAVDVVGTEYTDSVGDDVAELSAIGYVVGELVVGLVVLIVSVVGVAFGVIAGFVSVVVAVTGIAVVGVGVTVGLAAAAVDMIEIGDAVE
jgi:hypothetical protein